MSKRKNKGYARTELDEARREERALDLIKKVRKPTPPPGKFHTERVKPDNEEINLKEYRDRYNRGELEDDVSS